MLVDQTTAYNSRNLALDDIHVDTMNDLNILENETRRRILHTHLPFQFLPSAHLKKKAKVIIVNRNPKDRHVSQYNFFKKMVGTPENYSWEQYWDEMVLKGMKNLIFSTRYLELLERLNGLKVISLFKA